MSATRRSVSDGAAILNVASIPMLCALGNLHSRRSREQAAHPRGLRHTVDSQYIRGRAEIGLVFLGRLVYFFIGAYHDPLQRGIHLRLVPEKALEVLNPL